MSRSDGPQGGRQGWQAIKNPTTTNAGVRSQDQRPGRASGR